MNWGRVRGNSKLKTQNSNLPSRILILMNHALPWLLAILSGLSLALAMPGPGLGPLALIFPFLLLEALERGQGGWRPWLLGLLAGAVFWTVSTNWVVPVMHHYGGLPRMAAVGCLVGMGAYLGLLWAIAAGVSSLVPAGWRIWLFPVAWVAATVLQRFPPYGFTWTGPAAAFVDWPWLMDSLSVWGTTGLGWFVIALSSAVWGLFQFGTRRSAEHRGYRRRHGRDPGVRAAGNVHGDLCAIDRERVDLPNAGGHHADLARPDNDGADVERVRTVQGLHRG